MKKIFTFIVLFTLVFQPGLGASPSEAAQGSQPDEPASQEAPVASESPDLPGWPMPDKPVPHHEPGHLSGAINYTSQVEVVNKMGVVETVPLRGLDAMAADGIDPLAGNYTLVGLDKVMRSALPYLEQVWNVETFSISGTIDLMPGSHRDFGNYPSNDIAAGDLNGDDIDEQIVAYLDGDSTVNFTIGDLPGSYGKTTSAPAVVARGGASPEGNALAFDGMDDYVDAGSGINLANASFTVAFWAKRNSIDRNDFAVGHGVWGGSNAALHIGFRPNNTFSCDFFANDLNTLEGYTDSNWHYWACTYDAATKLRKIYRDGNQVAQDVAPSNYQGSGVLHIGNGPTGSVLNFNGIIDEVGIWSVARTAGRIQADMIRVEPDKTGLIAYWPFNEGSGTSTADASGTSHDGTLVNGPLWYPDNAPLGDLHLLVRGYDQALWHCIYDVESGRCLSWNEDAGGGLLLSPPAVVSRGAGQFDVFAVLHDNQVYQRHWSEAESWSGSWSLVGGSAYWPPLQKVVPVPELAAPAVVSRGGEQLDLFRLGPDNTLLWRHYDGSTWSDWLDLGGNLTSGPGATEIGTSSMQVFARGLDDSLWTRQLSGGTWGSWRRVPQTGMAKGVTIASAPAVISRDGGDIIVYVRGSDNHLWMVSNGGSGWSEWSEGGGNLASAPAAILAGGNPYLFSQTRSGGLQVFRESEGWKLLPEGLPPCCTNTDIGLTGKQKQITDGPIYKDYSVDIETGYFWGDRRSQIALGYMSGDYQASVALFDLSAKPGALGFTPEIITQVQLAHPVDYIRIATGNFIDFPEENDIGLDDIAVAYISGSTYGVDIFKFDHATRSLQLKANKNNSQTGWQFIGTLEVVSGDFDADGLDEIAVNSSWKRDQTAHTHCNVWGIQFFTRFYKANTADSIDEYTLKDPAYFSEVSREGSPLSASLDLAAGDVDGDGQDEIIRTWPVGFENKEFWCSYIPINIRHLDLIYAFKRQAEVVKLKSGGTWILESGYITPASKTPLGVSDFTGNSYGDRLATGDLDLDMIGETIWQRGSNGPSQWLDIYDYRQDPSDQQYKYQWLDSLQIGWGELPHLVTGDFSGESVRVGPPTYRLQNRVDTLVSQINLPPSHRDLVKDSSGNYHLIASPSEPCTATAGTPDCTHAKYGTKSFEESQETVQTQHAYSVSAGMESKGCGSGGIKGLVSLEACVTTSINYTHGGNFEKTTDTIDSTTFSRSVIATDDDKLIYFGTPYGVWEYPILNSPTSEAGGFITVVFPLITKTKDPSDADGYLACNEDWYAAGHQVNNIWSYDPISVTPPFEDYIDDDTYNPIFNAPMSTGSALEITYNHGTTESKSKEFKHKISAGRQIEAKAEAKIKIVNLTSSFKANINGEYEYTSMDTDVIKREAGTTFSLFLGPQPATARFTTQVIFYWAKSGYQVLNYETEPGAGSDWQYYTGIADPAFILPWYGFPEDPDPARDTYETPPCGSDKRLFSPDVQANPAIAGAGVTVEISATVRNFSNYALTKPVLVRFYLGDPSQNIVIGQDTLVGLKRQSGPMTAHITWTASGSGRQKIYAVIDPDKAIPEVHDEDDLINNNVAYTLIEIGSAAFADMGVIDERPYQGQTYSQGADMQVAFYMPTSNLGAVTRFDLKDSQEQINNVIGKAFELVAFDGSGVKKWDEPNTEFDITPKAGDLPATITVEYSSAILAGKNKASLRLYQMTLYGWKPAEEQCEPKPDGQPFEVQRFPDENMIAVPVCQPGTFVLAAGAPTSAVYLPIVTRR